MNNSTRFHVKYETVDENTVSKVICVSPTGTESIWQAAVRTLESRGVKPLLIRKKTEPDERIPDPFENPDEEYAY